MLVSLGLIFTVLSLYIIYNVRTKKESLEDKKIRIKNKTLKKENIGKSFPKKKSI